MFKLKQRLKTKKLRGIMLFIVSLVLILIIRFRYFSVAKSSRKSAAYEFFNPTYQNDNDAKLSNTQPIKLYNTNKTHPSLINFDGLDELYRFVNFSVEESKPFLAWHQMKWLLSRSDSLPETAQGIKEASVAWRELIMTIESAKLDDSKETKSCPYASVLNNTITKNISNVEIPCGLVEDSSITVIGIPDMQQGSFQIQLIGSKLPEDTKASIILRYNVFSAGENLTKEPVILQNTWSNESGWGSEEKCPNHGFTETNKVDGLTKCNAKVIRSSVEEETKSNSDENEKLSNVSRSTSASFPFVEGNAFTATLWAGIEGFHMTVNGRHETSFAYRERLEPWLVSGVEVKGGLEIISIIANGLPISEEVNTAFDIEKLKAPKLPKKRITMLIGVFSTGNNFERRMALRRSWMQYEAVRSGDVAVRFFIGLNKNNKVNFELWREAQVYGDIQLMPFVDYYSLLTLKTISICILGTKILPAKYIMKTDDDAFVRIDEILSNLKGKISEGLLLGLISYDSEPHREKDDKWYVSNEEWPHSTFPPWAHGPGYVISRDIAKFIVQGHQGRDLMLFKLEDVAMGIWINEYRTLGHEVQYYSDDRYNNAGCEADYILAHYQSPRMVLCLWEKLQKEHEPNCCE